VRYEERGQGYRDVESVGKHWATPFDNTSCAASFPHHTSFTDARNPHLTSVIDGSIPGREASFISTGSALGSLLITDGIITMSVACTSNMAEQVPIYPLYLQ
jgi:hypothetical protein